MNKVMPSDAGDKTSDTRTSRTGSGDPSGFRVGRRRRVPLWSSRRPKQSIDRPERRPVLPLPAVISDAGDPDGAS